jgi:hypothetical protein
MDKSDTFSCLVRGGTSVLALNSANNRLIAAGQKSKKPKKIVRFVFILIIK